METGQYSQTRECSESQERGTTVPVAALWGYARDRSCHSLTVLQSIPLP